jgi:hypothetical protein
MIAGTYITIEGIRFKILSLDKQINSTSISSFNRPTYFIPISNEIKMVAETTTKYYMALEKWRDDMMYRNGYASNYKKDFTKNGIQIIGMFPTDYFFKDNDKIEVTFSIDHYSGDFSLFKLKQERLEKLKRLNQISNGKSK